MLQSGTHLVSVEIPVGLAAHLLSISKYFGMAGLSDTDKDILIDALKDAINQDDA